VEHIHRDALGAFAHEGDAEVRPVGDQRREQRGIEAGIVNLLTLLLNPYPLWHNRPYDEPSMNPRIRRQRGGQT
jgi:hypothetical protein